MNSNKTVTANFELKKYTLALSADPAEGGSVSGAGTYDAGTDVSIEATPNDNYGFVNWTGDASGSTNPTTITMNSNKTVTANFVVADYTPCFQDGEDDCYGVSSSSDYDAGTNETTFTYTVWEKWYGDDKGKEFKKCKDISHFELNFGYEVWEDFVSMTVVDGDTYHIVEIEDGMIKMDDLNDGFKKGTITIIFTGCVEAETGSLTIKAGNKKFNFDVCKPNI